MDQFTSYQSWIEQWEIAGPLLAKFEHEELRALSFEKDWQLIDALLCLGFEVPNQKDVDSSGLVEQQRLFAKARP